MVTDEEFDKATAWAKEVEARVPRQSQPSTTATSGGWWFSSAPTWVSSFHPVMRKDWRTPRLNN